LPETLIVCMGMERIVPLLKKWKFWSDF